MLGVAVFDAGFGAVIVVTHLQVHHSSDRIRAINGRSTVLQNFDALNGSFRDRIQIHKHRVDWTRIISDGIGSNPAPIDEDESRSRVQTAQRNRSRAYGGVGAVLII